MVLDNLVIIMCRGQRKNSGLVVL